MDIKSVVVIGGSVSGLLQGLQLKRNGINVIMLEQDPSQNRHQNESGVSIGPSVVKLLEKYDDTGRPVSVPAGFVSAVWRKGLRFIDMAWKHNCSNWGCLYLVLRANFDGMASEAVPNPPEPRPGDGDVEYRAGKRVTSISYDQDKSRVHVEYVDVATGEKDGVVSSLVIAADGIHSTARRLMAVPTRKEYAGYIGWRGTVPEELLSKETVEYFSDRLHFSLLGGTYFISYIIPTTSGHVEHGKRLINWVWYYRVPADSPEMDIIFTDVNGKLHTNTVPHGLLNLDVWNSVLQRHRSTMAPPLAEIVSKTPCPFASKVVEAQCDINTTTFFDDRLVLVGDAFTSFRSHLGLATEQAARHTLQMEKVLRGEMTMKQRNDEASYYARRLIFLNRCIGLFGMNWVFSLTRAMMGYAWVVVSYNLNR